MDVESIFKAQGAVVRLAGMILTIRVVAKVDSNFSPAIALLHMVDLVKLGHRHLIALCHFLISIYN
jgi:hypothetical protein